LAVLADQARPLERRLAQILEAAAVGEITAEPVETVEAELFTFVGRFK
jgi:hypothetical protein